MCGELSQRLLGLYRVDLTLHLWKGQCVKAVFIFEVTAGHLDKIEHLEVVQSTK